MHHCHAGHTASRRNRLRPTAHLLLGLGLTTAWLAAAEFPQVEIANGQLRAKLFLPDANHGFYRGTRFDWSGVIGSLEYQGHNYYGPWFDRLDPQVSDYIYAGQEILAGPCSAITGPVEEFQTRGTALGWDEAQPGETFVKIGVGALRKDAAPYHFARRYEMADPGKWTVKTQPDAVGFTHELMDPRSGYGYAYHKTVRLAPGKPVLVLEHRLKNTGRRAITGTVYNHNFLVLDRQAPGPDFKISVPFPIEPAPLANPALAAIRGNQLVHLKPLRGEDRVQTALKGFSGSPTDHEIRIENSQVGAGLKITGDRPLSHLAYWSIRTVLAVEPFIAMAIDPGQEFTWQTTYEYYTTR